MLTQINDSAAAVGITAVITNSTERIETQLNSLTVRTDSPLMLISWDIDTALSFNEHGFLNNPTANIVALLVKKPANLKKETKEAAAEEMGELFKLFIQDLYDRLVPLMTTSDLRPITNATYKLVPAHGAGKHSGILARWTMSDQVINCS